MTLSQALATPVDEIMDSMELAPHNGFHLEPRCRICRNDLVRKKVNDLLSVGASFAMIVRALGDDNAELDTRDQVTVDSVRNHCRRHFPVQNVAKATYREILERRARDNHIDFVEGVTTALTPIAFFETVMVKSYENLVDSDTKVDVNTGIVAAGRLQSLIDSRDYEPRIVGDEGPDGRHPDSGACLLCRSRCGARLSRSWRRRSSIRRCSTSRRAPSMTTTSPSIRPSSSTRTTTSFDLRSAHRHRWRWGPLPVVDGRSRWRERSWTLRYSGQRLQPGRSFGIRSTRHRRSTGGPCDR